MLRHVLWLVICIYCLSRLLCVTEWFSRLQGLDEEGVKAYVAHLQEAFLRPQTSRSGDAVVQNGAAEASSSDDEEDEDEDDKDAATPEDAGRRHVPIPC